MWGPQRRAGHEMREGPKREESKRRGAYGAEPKWEGPRRREGPVRRGP